MYPAFNDINLTVETHEQNRFKLLNADNFGRDIYLISYQT